MKSAKNLLKKLNGGKQLSIDEWEIVRFTYFPFNEGDSVKYVGQSPKLKNGEFYTVDEVFFTKCDKNGRKDIKWFDNPEILVKLKYIDGSFPVYWFVGKNKSYSISLPASTKELSEEELIRLMNDAVEKEDYDKAIIYRTMLEKFKPKVLTLDELNTLMNDAVEKEDYETAATMRDMINKL